MPHRLRIAALLVLALASWPVSGAGRQPGSTVLPCAGVTLSASYLGEAAPGQGPGFLFHIENRTARPIRLAQPVPSGADWYALVGTRWLWRASAGRGGALVDAERPHGPMFAYRPAGPAADPEYVVVPAHDSRQWAEPIRENPAIAYRPSCRMCTYTGENQYQAVFSYAWLPATAQDVPDLLRCGLRSDPVPMPPYALEALRN